MNSSSCAIFPVIALLCAAPVGARDIHYGAVSDPTVLACDQEQWRGRTAAPCYAAIINSDSAAAAKAEAHWALKDLKQANEWFRRALEESPDDLDALVRWGDLFTESHQDAEAVQIYREVLEQDASSEFAMLGAARLLVHQFEDDANRFLQPLLHGAQDGPKTAALLLVARIALESGNIDEARDMLDSAELLILANDWPPLEVYALRAAADLLDNRPQSAWTQKALKFNPRFGEIYATPAHFYVITRRYREAIDLYQKAVDTDPGLATAHEALGANLLRDNQMSRARRHLEKAHDLDPFSPVAVNSLRLLDSFVNFRLVDDRRDDSVPITLRLHKDEAAAIAPYAIQLTRDGIAAFTQRYDFILREPVVIEMYPDHEDFAVRTAGMPGLGILGAAFGYVVAMDSPSGRPPEQFQWGTVLWHELAHVFTLEATDHLVPRWFSEGVSVFEEWRSGPNPGVRIPMSVYEAMQEDRFLPVAELDEGFIRPTYDGQVIVSYMQAGLVCDFIDSSFGTNRLMAMLKAYGNGLDTPAAVEAVLGMTAEEFDRRFARFIAEEHGPFLEQLDDWRDGQQNIAKRASSEDWKGVADLAAQLIDMLPDYVEVDSPYLSLARAHRARGDTTAARSALENYWRRGGYEPQALRQLGEMFIAENKREDAIDVLKSAILVDPFDLEVHNTLGNMLLAADRADEALREFEVALALEPHDMATAWYNLAQAEHALGNHASAQNNVLKALDAAPGFRPAQKLLLELASNTPE